MFRNFQEILVYSIWLGKTGSILNHSYDDEVVVLNRIKGSFGSSVLAHFRHTYLEMLRFAISTFTIFFLIRNETYIR